MILEPLKLLLRENNINEAKLRKEEKNIYDWSQGTVMHHCLLGTESAFMAKECGMQQGAGDM